MGFDGLLQPWTNDPTCEYPAAGHMPSQAKPQTKREKRTKTSPHPVSDTNRLVQAVAVATASSPNEENLRHEIEKSLEIACKALKIVWTPFQLERALRSGNGHPKFTDVAHGGVIIEYERPRSFGGGRSKNRVAHARAQAETYATLLSAEEGRAIGEYVLVVWDGADIAFGRKSNDEFDWEPVTRFDTPTAKRLLGYLEHNGIPLVHPRLISALAGPGSKLGGRLLPKLFNAICLACRPGVPTTRTKLLFVEWRRIFGQVVGVQSDKLKELLLEQGEAHGQDYQGDPAAYLFALNTYVAFVAKIVAALALPGSCQDIADSKVPIERRIEALESGQLYVDAGILNMLHGDFFSWYKDEQRQEKRWAKQQAI